MAKPKPKRRRKGRRPGRPPVIHAEWRIQVLEQQHTIWAEGHWETRAIETTRARAFDAFRATVHRPRRLLKITTTVVAIVSAEEQEPEDDEAEA